MVVAPVVAPKVAWQKHVEVKNIEPIEPALTHRSSLKIVDQVDKPLSLKKVSFSDDQVEPVALQEEIVLRVPKELSMQAMEIAIKSGKTNIRLEFI